MRIDRIITAEEPIQKQKPEDPRKVAEFSCNCKFPWLRELHGLTALMMSNSLNEKIFWLFVIGICAATSVQFVKWIMEEFSDNQFSTRITIIPVEKLKFPALVFCPKNGDNIHIPQLLTDMRSKIPNIPEDTAYDVMRYMIAGSGFDNVHEMFQSCYAGSQTLDCCAIFEPTFVMMRGRCFRLIDNYYQQDVDETDKLTLYFERIQGELLGNTTRPQLVMYISDSNPEVGLYPRVYLSLNDWNRLRFTQRKVSMIPGHSQCSTAPINQGKSTCFVYNWINRVVVQPLNCTLPFFKTMLPYMANVPVCDPLPVVENYDDIVSTKIDSFRCLPACERVENNWQMMNSIDTSPSPGYGFRLEVSFNELEYENYVEISLTTIPRFISELGGQSGLFLGCSVMTFVQASLGIVVFIYRRIRQAYRSHVAIPFTVK
ncbi:unnamed protein product [Nippostrongylus brasiliensis]|uniref:Acid-sensing ion channel 1 n=1 Tax=Nippostrongylus brasiliensis TaxID=27835 RepID=A0A0N4YF95_NIPBR|nr:unnamed protein product [Nippostrongylus brasiliensis]